MLIVLALAGLTLGIIGGLFIVAGQVALLTQAVTQSTASQRAMAQQLQLVLLQIGRDQVAALDRMAEHQRYIVLTVDGLAVAAIVHKDDLKVVKH